MNRDFINWHGRLWSVRTLDRNVCTLREVMLRDEFLTIIRTMERSSRLKPEFICDVVNNCIGLGETELAWTFLRLNAGFNTNIRKSGKIPELLAKFGCAAKCFEH